MQTRKKSTVVIAVIVILAIAAGLFYRFILYKPVPTTTTSTQKYKPYTVTSSDIALSVQGSGAVKAGLTTSVSAAYAGTVNAVKAADGDRVKVGDILATFELPNLETEIAQLRTDLVTADNNLKRIDSTTGTTAISSPVAGMVKFIHVAAGDLIDVAMGKYGALMVISVDKKMIVTIKPVSSAKVAAGQTVNVVIGTKTVTGRIREQLIDGSIVVLFDDTGYAVDTVAIVKATDGSAVGEGKMQINQPFMVTATGGIVNYLSTSVGKTVSVDQTLLRLKSTVLTPSYLQALQKRDTLQSDLKEKLALQKNQMIKATSAGIVSGLTLKVNDLLKEDQVVCSIIDDSIIELTLDVDELDIPTIVIGQTANITLDALTDKKYIAKVTKISAIGAYSGGVANYPVTLTIEKPTGILAGMSANATIIVSSSTNVPVIPLAALQTIGNRKYVLNASALNADGTLVATASTMTGQTPPTDLPSGSAPGTLPSGGPQNISPLAKYLIEVKVGLSTDNGVEIVSGIKTGDKIAIAVSSGNAGQPTGLNLGGMGGQFSGAPRPQNQGSGNQASRSTTR